MSPPLGPKIAVPPAAPDPVWGLLGRPTDVVLRSRELSLQWIALCKRADAVWRSQRGPVRLKKWQAIEHTKRGLMNAGKEGVTQ